MSSAPMQGYFEAEVAVWGALQLIGGVLFAKLGLWLGSASGESPAKRGRAGALQAGASQARALQLVIKALVKIGVDLFVEVHPSEVRP